MERTRAVKQKANSLSFDETSNIKECRGGRGIRISKQRMLVLANCQARVENLGKDRCLLKRRKARIVARAGSVQRNNWEKGCGLSLRS